MGTRLENFKKLREIGATPIMQDDVARYLGSYEHPLFIPTLDFIIKLRDAISMSVSAPEKGLEKADIPTAYEPDFFQKISIGGSLEAAKRSPEIEKMVQAQMVSYLSAIEGQAQRFEVVDEVVDALDRSLYTQKAAPKREKTASKSQKRTQIRSFLYSIVDSLVKGNVQTAENARNQNNKKNMWQRVQDFINPPKPDLKQLQQANQQPQPRDWKTKLFGKNRNNIINQQQARRQQQVMDIQTHTHQHTHDDHLEKARPKQQEQQKQAPQKTTKELISSQQIDKTIKTAKDSKVQAVIQDTKLEIPKIDEPKETDPKEKIKQNVIKKQAVTAQLQDRIEQQQAAQKRVADLDIDSAIKNLNKSGVKPQATDTLSMKDLKNLEAQKAVEAEKQKQR